MVEAVEAVLVAQVLHVEMELHHLQQHLQAALESVIQLQEPQRITAAAVVHLGTEVQLVGLVQVVLVVAGKEQTELPQLLVQTEQQTLAAVVVLVMSQLVVTVGQVSSLFDTEYPMVFLQFYLMLTTESDLKQPIFQLQMAEHFQAALQLHVQALCLLDGIQLQMVQVQHMH
jgi:hypothetical protein